jgi:hypothetical protein
MQAGTADLVLLYEPDHESELGCPQGAGVASAASAEHKEIKGTRHAAILSVREAR